MKESEDGNKMIFRHLKRLTRKNNCGIDGKTIEVFNEQGMVIRSILVMNEV